MSIDANARLGSVASQAVGNYASVPEDESGTLFREWAEGAGMAVATTFPEVAQGVQPGTWTSSNGSVHRLDYVVVSQSLMSSPLS
eukprot:3697770-Alexandrium_andersonii.AAC.1